ncbi:heavy metal translocating P-type ATPase [Salinisphaera hydrothermalis]|uniref:P-type Zn(2+) transporter n=1 Tax=Salinisphaera hydrothermalis (strain C41B8) TaxID=1304275 RepID=A0A084IGV3_SALHC|nr:heavy metal translocating P-type ATPase [Salinisphaera hydrothermalis]KEZ75937.1 heavy metal translocating P-type ATPase [Salinisphaera hydrothermalis C41B8]
MSASAKTSRFHIDGMDCAGCAAKIEGAARRVPGIDQVSVSVTARSLTVEHEADARLDTLEKRIRALGYSASRISANETRADAESPCGAHADHDACCGHDHGAEPEATAFDEPGADRAVTRYRISGMDCGGCAAKIDSAVRRVPGVDVQISVPNRRLTVQHGPDMSPAPLEKRVRALGYGIEREGDDGSDASHQRDAGDQDASPVTDAASHTAEIPWYRNTKLVTALASGVTLALAAVVTAIVPGYAFLWFGIPTLIGLVPVGRRAVMGAVLAGTPFSIEMLMSIAAVGAMALGATREAAVVVFLFLLGEWLEGVAASRARSSISALSDLVPKSAQRVEADGSIREVPASTLRPDMTVLVRPGDRIPADGVVIEGESAVDQAPVTGESTPVRKQANDTLYAGTINGGAALRVRVTAAANDNTIARVVRLVEQAQESKAPTERFIDRFSRYYTPGVVAVAVLIAVVPPLLLGGVWSDWIYRALAILLIGCPCALVISTPAAVAASLSAGARRGLLIKGGAILEALGGIDAVAFDKTGTLTEGRPRVTDVMALGDADEARVVRLAAAVEQQSSHPLARAVTTAAEARDLRVPAVDRGETLSGEGVAAELNGQRLFLGSIAAARRRAAIDADTESRLERLNDEGKSVAVLLVDDKPLGVLAMRDEPRPEALEALADLKRRGIDTVMLTGDNRRTAEAVGSQLGIDVRADLMPEDKQNAVHELQARGLKVAKVGDGINDAPALAAADVGIAMGGGTDVALETGDAASLHDDIRDVGAMVALSRRTLRNIHQNIGMAMGLKAIFLVTTIAGLTGLWPAILSDTGAAVLVTANALRLLRVPTTAAGQHRPERVSSDAGVA